MTETPRKLNARVGPIFADWDPSKTTTAVRDGDPLTKRPNNLGNVSAGNVTVHLTGESMTCGGVPKLTRAQMIELATRRALEKRWQDFPEACPLRWLAQDLANCGGDNPFWRMFKFEVDCEFRRIQRNQA